MRGRKQSEQSTRRPSRAELETRRDELRIDANALSKLEPQSALTTAERKIWDEVVPQLTAAGLICSLDTSLLTKYCRTSAQVTKLECYLDKHGFFIEKSNGTKCLRAEYKLCESLEKKLTRLAECMGLTPKSRRTMNISLSFQPQRTQLSEEKAKILRRQKTGEDET